MLGKHYPRTAKVIYYYIRMTARLKSMRKDYIALLRGINVGGNTPMKMDKLRDCLTTAGFANVRTYIASGNVLLSSELPRDAVESTIATALKTAFAYEAPVVTLSREQFLQVCDEVPVGFGTKPKIYHSDVIFIKPPLTVAGVKPHVSVRGGVDTASYGTHAVYFTRVSAERTKSHLGKIIGSPVYGHLTIRSWQTVNKLRALLETEQS